MKVGNVYRFSELQTNLDLKTIAFMLYVCFVSFNSLSAAFALSRHMIIAQLLAFFVCENNVVILSWLRQRQNAVFLFRKIIIVSVI